MKLIITGSGKLYEVIPVGEKGERGEKGTKGDQGIQGFKGDVGENGDQGERGIQGVKGDAGLTGTKGSKGDQGDRGEQGLKGDAGERGLRGIQGFKGDVGDKGDQGERGIQGLNGADGLDGADGIKGDDGLTGAKGDKGDKGDAGERGYQGIKGDIGARGLKGDKGEQGERGIQGVQGIQGIKGDKGDKGDKGAQGTGLNILGKFNTPDELPSVANRGDGYLISGNLWVWTGSAFEDTGSIQGEKGEKGAKGDKGDQGDQGFKGDQGVQGEKGEKGEVGSAATVNSANVSAAGAVMKTENENISGIKTFTSSPIIPTPTTNMQAATKKYVDDNAGDIVLGTSNDKAYYGGYGEAAYQHSTSAHAPVNAQKNSDITKAEIEAKLTGAISTHSHTTPKEEDIFGSVQDSLNVAGTSSINIFSKSHSVLNFNGTNPSITFIGLPANGNSITKTFETINSGGARSLVIANTAKRYGEFNSTSGATNLITVLASTSSTGVTTLHIIFAQPNV